MFGADCRLRSFTVALNIVIGIPTVGRAVILRETLRALARQTRKPDRVILCGTKQSEIPGSRHSAML